MGNDGEERSVRLYDASFLLRLRHSLNQIVESDYSLEDKCALLMNREEESIDNGKQDTTSPMELNDDRVSQSKVEEVLPLDSTVGVEDRCGEKENVIVDSMYSGDMCMSVCVFILM